MKVVDYMAANDLDDQQLADRLEMQVRGVRGMKNREMPRGWCEKLGVDFDVQAAAAERERFTSGTTRRDADDEPPLPHDPTAVRDAPKPPAPIADVAQERIASAYGGIGFALAKRSGNDGYQAVTDDQAPAMARAWVKAAEENEFAKRVVSMMGSGGAAGDLVMSHIVWIMGLAYVSGRSDLDPLGTYARRYGQFRPVVRFPAGDADRQTQEDGAGDGHPGPHAAVG